MMRQTSLVIVTVLGLVAACRGTEAGQDLPLAELRIGHGQAAAIETVKDGFVIRNKASIEGRVVAPADAFPCRLAPAADHILQLSIGRVDSLRCNSLFSPSRDEAITFEADRVELRREGDHYRLVARGPLTVRIERDFMKLKRGLTYFRPLDKSAFPRAPAGWCSWYFYYQGTREQDVVRNTDWLAANLKKFGCEYVQIDDGWQGVGHGWGMNRDWYVTDKRKFPHGMKWMADYIRSKGLRPGIWLIPFVTSDTKLFCRQPDLFIRRADGTSAFEVPDPKTEKIDVNWTGRYPIDPTNPAARQWCTDLFHTICKDWGYDYVKIDGQGSLANVYNEFRNRLADPRVPPDTAYRLGLAAIKSQMGPRQFLLNCGCQSASCGYCEGMRTGDDVVGGDWSGIETAVQATVPSLSMNNICFWTDPDVVCVRPPLGLEQARVWATLLGITGQLLMTSDDMPALSEDRVELLRRIFPVADIRPMDLYYAGGRPRIFDLRVELPEVGQWDVVAMFNWDTFRMASIRLDPKELGWTEGRYVYYDVWGKKLLGVGTGDLALSIPPASCRVVAARRQTGHPQLVGTSRHITQGADDLVEAAWTPATATWSGQSRVVAGDPYELRFTLPRGWSCAEAGVKIEGPLAVLTLRSEASKTMPWRIAFRQGPAAAAKPTVRDVAVTVPEPVCYKSVATVSWKGEGAIAYRVYRNGALVAQTVGTSLADGVRPGGTYAYAVSAVTWEGETPLEAAAPLAMPPPPRGKAKDAWLDELKPLSHEQDCLPLGLGRSVEGKPLRVGGKEYAHGLGTHAFSRTRYLLENRYRQFEAEVGVDDEKDGAGSVVFQIFADDRKVFDSGVMRGKQPAKKVSIPLGGVEELTLVVTDAGDGISCDHADWASARLLGNR